VAVTEKCPGERPLGVGMSYMRRTTSRVVRRSTFDCDQRTIDA